jgi:basic membrane lipoprotein Med (substrate-binding protein (PBP1-ABC) superfamily)
VKYIDPSIQVLVSYVGSFQGVAKGKELMMPQYDQGAGLGAAR